MLDVVFNHALLRFTYISGARMDDYREIKEKPRAQHLVVLTDGLSACMRACVVVVAGGLADTCRQWTAQDGAARWRVVSRRYSACGIRMMHSHYRRAGRHAWCMFQIGGV